MSFCLNATFSDSLGRLFFQFAPRSFAPEEPKAAAKHWKGRHELRADRLEADVTRSMVRQFSQLTQSQRKSVGARSSFAAMLDTGLEALFDRIPAFYLKDLTWRDFEDKPRTIKAEVSLFPDCCEYFLTDSCRFVR